MWTKLPPAIRQALVAAAILLIGAVSEALVSWLDALSKVP